MPYLTGTLPAAGDYICRRLYIPNTEAWRIAVNGALSMLTKQHVWERHGQQGPAEAAAMAVDMYLEFIESEACMIGAIMPYVTDSPPPAMLECNGLQYQRADFPRLYDALPAEYHAGPDYFHVPDLRGLFIMAADNDNPPGTTGGAATVTLTAEEMPSHTHTTQPHTHGSAPHTHTTQPHTHNAQYPMINIDLELPGAPDPLAAGNPPILAPTTPAIVVVDPATVTIDGATVTIDSTGADQAHENRPPFVALKYGIVAR